jgi:hypothetical protein
MSEPDPTLKRGGYSGSKSKEEILAPKSKGATETPETAPAPPTVPETEKSAAA